MKNRISCRYCLGLAVFQKKEKNIGENLSDESIKLLKTAANEEKNECGTLVWALHSFNHLHKSACRLEEHPQASSRQLSNVAGFSLKFIIV